MLSGNRKLAKFSHNFLDVEKVKLKTPFCIKIQFVCLSELKIVIFPKGQRIPYFLLE